MDFQDGDKTTQVIEEALGVEEEGETEAEITTQTNKGDEDEQIDEGEVEKQEVSLFSNNKGSGFLHGRIVV